MSHSPSEADPSPKERTSSDDQVIITADPLIPKPVGMGTSNVVSTSSPIHDLDSTSQWKSSELVDPPKQAQSDVIHNLIPEENTQVWHGQSSQKKQRSQKKQGDLESTDEWFPPSERPLTDPSIVDIQDDLSDLNDTQSPQLTSVLLSQVDVQPHQIEITSSSIGWDRDAILVEIICFAILGLSLLGPFSGLFAYGWSFERFGLFFGLTSVLWLVIFLVALGTRRRQQISINQAWVTYTILFPSGLPLKRRFPFSDLQEISLGAHPSASSGQEWIVLTGKNQVIAFGAHLSEAERKVIFERLQSKTINLQQGIFS
jgi:hypothetical protein